MFQRTTKVISHRVFNDRIFRLFLGEQMFKWDKMKRRKCLLSSVLFDIPRCHNMERTTCGVYRSNASATCYTK